MKAFPSLASPPRILQCGFHNSLHGVAQSTFVLLHTILSIPLHSILFVQQGLPIGQSADYVKTLSESCLFSQCLHMPSTDSTFEGIRDK